MTYLVVALLMLNAPAPHDALVPGTGFNAVATIPCAVGGGQPAGGCEAGVVRRGAGDASVRITLPGGGKRTIEFTKGVATGSDAGERLSVERTGDLARITIGATERYDIPDAFIYGG